MATIYVYLPDEAVDTWRPVEAEPAGGGFRIVSERPDDEQWEFESSDVVRCEMRTLLSGGPSSAALCPVAVERLAPG